MKTKIFNGILAVLIILSGFTHGVYAQVKSLDRVVAIVDDDVIMASQLNSRLREIMQSVSKRGGQLPSQEELVKQVLDRLIIEDLQLQLAARFGITVEDNELNAAVADVARRNNLSPDQFKAQVIREGLSFDSIKEQIRNEVIINQVRQRAVGDRIRISNQEVDNFLHSELGKLQLSAEYYLASILVPVSQGSSYNANQQAEQKAKKIYQQLMSGADFAKLAMSSSGDDKALEGGVIGWRQAAQLPPPFDQMINGLKVGDFTQPVSTPGGFIILKVLNKRGGSSTHLQDEISVRHILLKPSKIRTEQETEKAIQRLYDRVIAGESFSSLAKKFSDDPGSASRGGDLNWIDPATLVPAFRQVMDVTPVGEVSKPFRTPYGWHILEVLGRRSTDNSAEYRKQQALNILYGRKFDQEVQVWLQQLRDEAYVEIKL